jgi:hypothetical protein
MEAIAGARETALYRLRYGILRLQAGQRVLSRPLRPKRRPNRLGAGLDGVGCDKTQAIALG